MVQLNIFFKATSISVHTQVNFKFLIFTFENV